MGLVHCLGWNGRLSLKMLALGEMKRLLLLTILLLAACARTPHHQAPESVLESLPAGDSEAIALEPWLENLNWPELPALLDEAMANNRDLHQAALNLQRAEAQVVGAGGGGRPQAQLSLDSSRSRLELFGTSTRHNLSLQSSWELDIWRRYANEKKAARLTLAQQASLGHWARLSLQANVARRYLDLTLARQLEALAREQVQALSSSYEIIYQRYGAGLASALDLRLAESTLANARATLQQRHSELQQQQRQMEIVLGRLPQATLMLDAELPVIPEPIVREMTASMLTQRPDIEAARLGFASALAREKAAYRALWPSIRLNVSTGAISNELSMLLDEDRRLWSAGLGILQPLLDGGQRRMARAVASVEVEQARTQYEQQVMTALADVAQALANEQLLRAQGGEITLALESASASWELGQEDYAAGLINVLNLLDTYNRYISARIASLQMNAQIWQNRITLYLALAWPARELRDD